MAGKAGKSPMSAFEDPRYSAPEPPQGAAPAPQPTPSGRGALPTGPAPQAEPEPAAPQPEPEPAPTGGGAGNCPPGQVWRTDSQGAFGSGRAGCEPEGWRSSQDRDTCLGVRPNCGPGMDAWCDFSTASWKCASIVKPQSATGPGSGDIRTDPAAGLQNNLRYGHAHMVVGRNDLAGNVGLGRGDDSTTWSECWKVPSGEKVPCPAGLKLNYSGGAGGAGGAGGGGFGGQGGIAGLLEQLIGKSLNDPSRYTPEAMQALQGEIARQYSGAVTRGERGVRAEAARRGTQRWGQTDAAIRAVREGAEQARGSASVGVQTAKLTADYQDRVSAMDRAQKYLDSLRDDQYRWSLTAEQRRQYDANLALSYANLAQQRQNLTTQMQSQWDMLRANQGFAALMMGT